MTDITDTTSFPTTDPDYPAFEAAYNSFSDIHFINTVRDALSALSQYNPPSYSSQDHYAFIAISTQLHNIITFLNTRIQENTNNKVLHKALTTLGSFKNNNVPQSNPKYHELLATHTTRVTHLLTIFGLNVMFRCGPADDFINSALQLSSDVNGINDNDILKKLIQYQANVDTIMIYLRKLEAQVDAAKQIIDTSAN